MNKIVVADNDALMRTALKKLIQQIPGFEVVYEASNGQEAIDYCVHQDVDMVFMDIRMPVKNGMEAILEIRQSKPNLTMYILTSLDSFEMVQFAMQNNVRRYMTKPVSPKCIHEVLTEYLKEGVRQRVVKNRHSTLTADLYEAISDRDFERAYKSLPAIAQAVYVVQEEGIREAELGDMARRLYVTFLPMKNLEELLLLHPLTPAVQRDVRMIQIWLFKVMNYIFTELSAERQYILKSVFDYMDSHLHEDISLRCIVKHCNISQGYVSRIFKTHFNITIMQYLHMKKLNLAKEYLCMTHLSGTDISYKVGYNDFSYFCKVFKKYENSTVSEYRGS